MIMHTPSRITITVVGKISDTETGRTTHDRVIANSIMEIDSVLVFPESTAMYVMIMGGMIGEKPASLIPFQIPFIGGQMSDLKWIEKEDTKEEANETRG